MWYIILNHFLDSETESGVVFAIQANPASKIRKKIKNGQNFRKLKNFETYGLSIFLIFRNVSNIGM